MSSTAPKTPARGLPAQVLSFALIGVCGTATYLALYVLLRGAVSAQPANLGARLMTAVVTTSLNGRHTFRSRVSRRRLYLGAVSVTAAGSAVSGFALAVEQRVAGADNRSIEVLTLILATAAAAVLRFMLLRRWVFVGSSTSSTSDCTPVLVIPSRSIVVDPASDRNQHVQCARTA